MINGILILLLMGSLNSMGQNSLTPCVDFSNEINQIKKYNEHLEKVLMNNLKEDYIIRFIAKPTYKPEYAFQIRKIDNSNFEIEAVFFQENLWNVQSINPSVYVRKRNINKELVLKIDALFKVFTNSISNKDALVIGEDGTSFIFKRKTKDGARCGETWSPNETSPLGKLVCICNVLTEYAKGEYVELEKVHENINKLYDSMK
ncbi:MAG TPA: hypothetical protein PLB65_08420 [Candidatus Cloacimonas sp.]|nr:hypothetical protein [Candidatus Cloacimonas sp.]